MQDADLYTRAVNQARADYQRMVRAMRTGQRFSVRLIDRLCDAALKTDRDLIHDVLVGADRPGGCERCGVWLRVYSSRRVGNYQQQYLCCPRCGHKPARNKRTVPVEAIRPRTKSSTTPSDSGH